MTEVRGEKWTEIKMHKMLNIFSFVFMSLSYLRVHLICTRLNVKCTLSYIKGKLYINYKL